MGSTEFKGALLDDEKSMRACLERGVGDAREMREVAWERALASFAAKLSIDLSAAGSSLKSAVWKIAIAGYLKRTMLCRNAWLANGLNMGTKYGVSRT